MRSEASGTDIALDVSERSASGSAAVKCWGLLRGAYMGWTKWRKIADRKKWYGDELDWDGPACYELSMAGPRGGDLRPVYVGETANERKRVIAYASHGSHLSEIIKSHLRQRWTLWYRATAMRTKADAVAMQNRLLGRFDYDWNILLNTRGKKAPE